MYLLYRLKSVDGVKGTALPIIKELSNNQKQGKTEYNGTLKKVLLKID